MAISQNVKHIELSHDPEASLLGKRSLSGKSPAIVNIGEWFAQHQCNLAAKESGLGCTCVNNADFTVLVSGGQ